MNQVNHLYLIFFDINNGLTLINNISNKNKIKFLPGQICGPCENIKLHI